MKLTALFISSLIVINCALISQTVIPFGISKDSIFPQYSTQGNFNYTQGAYGGSRSFYFYKPTTYNPTTSPILIALHGTGGTGLEPISHLMAIADRRQALIIGIDNQLSHAAESAYIDTLNEFHCVVKVPDVYLLKEIYQYVLNRESRTNVPVYLIGFSMGGQFVTRYMLIRQAYPDSIPIKMAVSVNPYYYTFPTDTFNGVPMPWLSGLIFSPANEAFTSSCDENDTYYTFKCPEHIKQYYNENYGVLIGTADTAHLSDNASAMAQGSNRYQRAQTFYNFGLTDAPHYGATLNWKYREVVGVGHNQSLLYNNKNLPTDTFTIAERLLFDTPYKPTTQLAPIASFTSNLKTVTLPNATVSFSNNSIGATSYLWDFGDGNTSTQINPTHTYTYTADSTLGNGISGFFYFPGSFYLVQLKATNATGCSNWDISSKQYIRVLPNPTITAITNNNLINEAFSLYPNPTNEIINIKLLMVNETHNITITNTLGQVVLQHKLNNQQTTINVQQLQNGIYFIELRQKEKLVATKKFVKE